MPSALVGVQPQQPTWIWLRQQQFSAVWWAQLLTSQRMLGLQVFLSMTLASFFRDGISMDRPRPPYSWPGPSGSSNTWGMKFLANLPLPRPFT